MSLRIISCCSSRAILHAIEFTLTLYIFNLVNYGYVIHNKTFWIKHTIVILFMLQNYSNVLNLPFILTETLLLPRWQIRFFIRYGRATLISHNTFFLLNNWTSFNFLTCQYLFPMYGKPYRLLTTINLSSFKDTVKPFNTIYSFSIRRMSMDSHERWLIFTLY